MALFFLFFVNKTALKVGGDTMGYKIMVVDGDELSPIEGTYETLIEACNMCNRIITANGECGSGCDPARWEFQVKELETGNMYPCYYYGD